MWNSINVKPKECGWYVVFNKNNLAESAFYDTEKGWMRPDPFNMVDLLFWCHEPEFV